MHRFYAPDIAKSFTLPEEEAQHCVRVLRMKEGDAIEVVDGVGNLYKSTIIDAHPKHCMVRIDDVQAIKPHWGCHITLAIAPTKNLDRMEWLAEKITEMGVA